MKARTAPDPGWRVEREVRVCVTKKVRIRSVIGSLGYFGYCRLCHRPLLFLLRRPLRGIIIIF